MDRDRFHRAAAIFRAACAVAAEDRRDFVDRAAAGDESLRAEVLTLLSEDVESEGLLDRPALGAPMAALDEASFRGAMPPTIPGYRVGRAIGRGGMGIVFEAEQMTPRRRVAIKVMRCALPSHESTRRFAREAQALARLQHPGIAQIFASGSCEDLSGVQPFLAMEYVDGEPITDAAARFGLDVRERVELIASVCDALQHAHQRGVIHRDLKPANILLPARDTSDSGSAPGPQPKILDFGIARILRDEGSNDGNEDKPDDVSLAATYDGQVIGTLAYMSPEQATFRRDDVDTRSDIYALGVIAFELLTGRLPYEIHRTDPLATARVIRETPAERLVTVDRRLGGALDTVIGKALEKDRSHRYQSASELAADLRRHLRGEPIAARPPTLRDQLRSIVRRHRAASAVAVVAVFLLAAATVGIALSWSRAVAARDEARRQAAIAQAIGAFLDEDLLGALDPELSRGEAVTVRETLDRAALTIGTGRFDGEPLVEASLRGTIGRAYRKLGLLTEAEPHLRAARELRRHQEGSDERETIRADDDLANLLVLRGQVDEAETLYRHTLEEKRRLLGEHDRSTILAYDNLASLIRRDGRIDEAIALHERAYALAQQHLAAGSSTRARVTAGYAALLRGLDRLDEARTLFRDALDSMRTLYGDDGKETLRIMNSLALVEWKLGRHQEAEALIREAIERHGAQVGLQHPNVLAYRANLGQLLLEIGETTEAIVLLRDVVLDCRTKLGVDHRGTLRALRSLADAERSVGDPRLADAYYTELIERWIVLDGSDSPDAASARRALEKQGEPR